MDPTQRDLARFAERRTERQQADEIRRERQTRQIIEQVELARIQRQENIEYTMNQHSCTESLAIYILDLEERIGTLENQISRLDDKFNDLESRLDSHLYS